MPLIKSGSRAAISQNIAEMIRAGHPRNQAIAAAESTARKYGKASGGEVEHPKKSAVKIASEIQRKSKQHMATGGVPFYVRSEAYGMGREGMIHSAVPGRTDRIPTNLRNGSYVIPAAAVSGLGEGNSTAGANGLNKLFRMGPYGTSLPHIQTPGIHKTAGIMRQHFARGGTVPVIVAGGEFIVPPEKVAEIGGGDMKRGHDLLDEMVKHVISKTSKTLKKLPGPKK